MSKTLSLKLKDEVFNETEDILEKIHKPRNSYINEAVSSYNKFIKRSLLKKRLKKESSMVTTSSLKVLHEMELLEDEIPE